MRGSSRLRLYRISREDRKSGSRHNRRSTKKHQDKSKSNGTKGLVSPRAAWTTGPATPRTLWASCQSGFAM
jgi:hypothetical protein